MRRPSNGQHFVAGRVRRALIESRHVAADHQSNHVLPTVLGSRQLAGEFPVAQHDDAVGQFFDFAQAVRNVHDAHAARSQVANDLEQAGLLRARRATTWARP